MARRITVNRNGFSGSGAFMMIKDDLDWSGFLSAAAAKVFLPKVLTVYGSTGERYTAMDEILAGDDMYLANGEPFVERSNRINTDMSNVIFWRQGYNDPYDAIDFPEGGMTARALLDKIRSQQKRFCKGDLQLCQEEKNAMIYLEADDLLMPRSDGNPNFRVFAQNVVEHPEPETEAAVGRSSSPVLRSSSPVLRSSSPVLRSSRTVRRSSSPVDGSRSPVPLPRTPRVSDSTMDVPEISGMLSSDPNSEGDQSFVRLPPSIPLATEMDMVIFEDVELDSDSDDEPIGVSLSQSIRSVAAVDMESNHSNDRYVVSEWKSDNDGRKEMQIIAARKEVAIWAKKGGSIDGRTSGDLEQLKKTIKHLESFMEAPTENRRGRKALQMMLYDAFAIEYLHSFLQLQDCTEMIDFLIINHQFKNFVSMELAWAIFDIFVKPEGPRAVNLQPRTVRFIKDLLDSHFVAEGLFTVVEMEIEEYIVRTVFPAFFESRAWQFLVDAKNAVSERDIVFCNSELHVAACGLRGTRIQELLEKHHPLNTRNYKRDTALHIVLSKCHETKEKILLPFVQYMAAKGADANAQNLEGDTPLHLAARENCLLLVNALLKSKVPPNLRLQNVNGELSVDLATKKKVRDVLRAILLEDVGKQEDRGPLDFIAFDIEWIIHPQVDAEHKEIVAVINQIATLIDEKEDYLDVLNDLYRIECVHHDHEEQLMRYGNYPNTKKHTQAHRKIEKILANMISNYSTRSESTDHGLLAVLGAWFKEHVFEHDKAFAPYIANVEIKF